MTTGSVVAVGVTRRSPHDGVAFFPARAPDHERSVARRRPQRTARAIGAAAARSPDNVRRIRAPVDAGAQQVGATRSPGDPSESLLTYAPVHVEGSRHRGAPCDVR